MRGLALLLAPALLAAGCLTAPPASASECGRMTLEPGFDRPIGHDETLAIELAVENCGSGTLSLFVGGCSAFSTRLARGDRSWALADGAADEVGVACPAVVGPPLEIAPGATHRASYAWNGSIRTEAGAFERAKAGPYEIVATARTESGTQLADRLRVEVAGNAPAEATVAGWRFTWEPTRLEGAPGEAVRFAITLAPASEDAEPGTLFAGNWVRFADGNTSKEVPEGGATFHADALAGTVDLARFHLTTPAASGDVEGPAVVALGGERHAAWAGRAKEPGPEGLTVTSDGSTIRVRYQLGEHGDACNLAINPQAKLVRLGSGVHLFVAYAMTDVCAAGEDPYVVEGEASGLPAGAYRVKAHLGVTACFCPAPPGGWTTREQEAVVTA